MFGLITPLPQLLALLAVGAVLSEGRQRSGRYPKILAPQQEPCDIVCTEEWAPVCVAGRTTPLTTVSNECHGYLLACEKQEPLYLIHAGECLCQKKPPSRKPRPITFKVSAHRQRHRDSRRPPPPDHC